MKIGSFVYATDQGLGVLAKDFHDEGVVTNVMVIRHGRRPEHSEWYPDSPWVYDLNSPSQRQDMVRFASDMDAMLFFETPFWWPIIKECKAMGVRTFLMPMHECMPRTLPYEPDFYVNPSRLDQDCFPERSTFIPVPVPERVRTSWRRRERAEVFVHNAGHGGLKGRNGTAELIQAWRHVQSPIRLIVRTQSQRIEDHAGERNAAGGSLEIVPGTLPYDELWRDGGEGDVFVFPERFNGLSLPLQEAHAAGMLVMATDRYPMNTWLPTMPLLRVTTTRPNEIGHCRPFVESVVEPRDIAAAIDWWHGHNIGTYSDMGREWAERNSWAALRPRWLEVLEKGVR